MNEILTGTKPTELFRKMLLDRPHLRNVDIADAFKEAFIRVDSEAIEAIWHWKKPGREVGIADALLDEMLADYLTGAGYVLSVPSPASTDQSEAKKGE